MEISLTLEQVARLELYNVSYYMHRYNKDTGKYIIRFSDHTQYSKAYYLLGVGLR